MKSIRFRCNLAVILSQHDRTFLSLSLHSDWLAGCGFSQDAGFIVFFAVKSKNSQQVQACSFGLFVLQVASRPQTLI